MLKKRLLIITLLLLFTITTKVQAFTVVLDPGHGGIDSGAVSGSLYESDVVLKIAKYLREYLQEYENVSVYLTHEGIASGELTVFDRAIMAREKNADLLVSLHINSSTSSTPNGAEVYVTANTSLDKYNKDTSALANKILANLKTIGIANRGVQTRLLTTDTTDRYSDGTMADYYGIIRYAMRGTKIDYGVIWPEGKEPANIQNGEGVPAILVEHCFISSATDRTYIETDEGIKKIAKADADAIVSHYGLTKKSETERILGDPSGDGKVTAADYVIIKNYIMENRGLETAEAKKAADVNKDEKITAADYVLIKNHIMNGTAF